MSDDISVFDGGWLMIGTWILDRGWLTLADPPNQTESYVEGHSWSFSRKKIGRWLFGNKTLCLLTFEKNVNIISASIDSITSIDIPLLTLAYFLSPLFKKLIQSKTLRYNINIYLPLWYLEMNSETYFKKVAFNQSIFKLSLVFSLRSISSVVCVLFLGCRGFFLWS